MKSLKILDIIIRRELRMPKNEPEIDNTSSKETEVFLDNNPKY